MIKEMRGPTILYIMGAGRSGSTILSILLGAHPEIESVGELKAWSKYRGLPREQDEKKEDFKFWLKVLRVYTQIDKNYPKFEKINDNARKCEKNWRLLPFLLGILDCKSADEYISHNDNLFNSIYKVSGKNVILDSSKNLCRAFMLLTFSRYEVRVIHLIRDPRGVVWSFKKKGVEQEAKNIFKVIFDYILINSASLILRLRFKECIVKIKYESLLKNPTQILNKIINFVGIEDDYLNRKIENDDEFEVNHLIDGNRIRKNKKIKFNRNDEWRGRLPSFFSILTKTLGYPFYLL